MLTYMTTQDSSLKEMYIAAILCEDNLNYYK